MYDESIRVAPLDKILSETDSPFAAPVPFRGKRNEPVYVEEVVKKLAAIKNISVEEMAARILENAKKVFGI
jgi:TatD DNase family protein